MDDNQKLINEQQSKIKEIFSDDHKLHEYLFQTMDNFYFRYLETTENQNLKTFQIAPNIYGTESFEISMPQALKVSDPEIKSGITELAKTVPKAERPRVKYRLDTRILEFGSDKGHLKITALVSWDFPYYLNKEKMKTKEVDFKYTDLNEFRKNLALKLEEACELFN